MTEKTTATAWRMDEGGEAETWDDVRTVVEASEAMHFDNCHKSYLSMDQGQVEQMTGYGYIAWEPDFDRLRQWWDESCALRFIEAVSTGDDGADVYVQVIPQFSENF